MIRIGTDSRSTIIIIIIKRAIIIMKWTTLSSILLCAADFVTAVVILVICSYNITVTSSREQRLPVPLMDTWRAYLTQMVPIMAYIMVISVLSCWGVTRKRKPCIAFLVLTLHLIALVVCIVYIHLLSTEMGRVETTPETLKNNTVGEFLHHTQSDPMNKKWVPAWLVTIQKQSEGCCGIIGYQDYREFWSGNQAEVPPSCCRSEKKCITNLDEIEWPEKPTDYIKNDEGCAAIINLSAMQRIKETLKFFIVLAVLLALAIFVFALQYIREYFMRADKTEQSGNNKDCLLYCKYWVNCRRRPDKKVPAVNVDQNGNPLVDPYNPLLISTDDPNIDLNDQSTYSYTYITQLKQTQQRSDSQQPFQTDSAAAATTINQESFQNQPPTFTYEVIQTTIDPFFLPPIINSPSNQMDTLAIDSQPDIRNMLGAAAAAGPQNQQNTQVPSTNSPDDLDKQNLKQLLRFGRRHRRHRKDFDTDQQP